MWIKRCKLLTSAPTLLQLTMEAGAGKGVFLCGGGGAYVQLLLDHFSDVLVRNGWH